MTEIDDVNPGGGGELISSSGTYHRETFSGQYFTYLIVIGCRFINCNFNEIDARLAVFSDCVFIDCTIDNANFQYTTFRECRFENRELSGYKIDAPSFGGAIFEGCSLFEGSSITFTNISFRDSRFINCKCGAVVFDSCSLEGALLDSCYFESLDFSYSATSGALYKNTAAINLKFSFFNFSEMIGAWGFFSSENPVLVDYAGGSVTAELHNEIEILTFIDNALLVEQRKKFKSLSRICVACINLHKHDHIRYGDMKALVKFLYELFSQLPFLPAANIDQATLSLRAFMDISLYDPLIIKAAQDFCNEHTEALDTVHPHIKLEFESAYSEFISKSSGRYFVTLRLNGADFLELVEFYINYQKFVKELFDVSDDFLIHEIKPGSSFWNWVVGEKSITKMIVVFLGLACIGDNIINIKLDIQVDIDVNKLIEEILAQNSKQLTDLRNAGLNPPPDLSGHMTIVDQHNPKVTVKKADLTALIQSR